MEFPDRYIHIRGVKLRYWDAGAGDNPILLIHGFGASVEIWRPVMHELMKRHRVLALDLPGFGRSDKPEAAYTLVYMSNIIRQFLLEQDIPRATLIGHSYGGAVALRFALESPDRLDRLALIAPAALDRRAHPLLRLMTLPGVGELLSLPSRAGTRMLFQLATYNRAAISDALIEESYQLAKLPGAQRSFLRTLRAAGNLFGQLPGFRNPVVSRLSELSIPTLVLWGEQDRIVPAAYRAARSIPNVRVEAWNGCGHLPWFEQAERFNSLMVEFLPDRDLVAEHLEIA